MFGIKPYAQHPLLDTEKNKRIDIFQWDNKFDLHYELVLANLFAKLFEKDTFFFIEWQNTRDFSDTRPGSCAKVSTCCTPESC